MNKKKKPNKKCLRCTGTWHSYKPQPSICPFCKSSKWNQPKKTKIELDKKTKILSNQSKITLVFALLLEKDHFNENTTQKELSKKLKISQPSVANYFKELRKINLINVNNKIEYDTLYTYFSEHINNIRTKSKDTNIKSQIFSVNLEIQTNKQLKELFDKNHLRKQLKKKQTKKTTKDNIILDKLKDTFLKEITHKFMRYLSFYQETKIVFSFEDIFQLIIQQCILYFPLIPKNHSNPIYPDLMELNILLREPIGDNLLFDKPHWISDLED